MGYKENDKERCPWCYKSGKMISYHDNEWGRPVYDDRAQFEHLSLEVMQCGLNWNMMIEKREIFHNSFSFFDYEKVALYKENDVERVLSAEGMIRAEKKVRAIITNAVCFKEIIKEYGSFTDFIWNYAGGRTILYQGHEKGRIPSQNALSERLSKELKKRGFKFTGPIVMYSHMQAVGIINDHSENCFCYKEIVEKYPVVRKKREGESF